MTFNDIFQSSFLESVSEFSLLDTVIGLAAALIIGLFIFVIYKKTLTGVMYSTGFALTLVGLSLVTTLVIMAVTSNVVLSLGMVGALSIVRFRAAIKEPVEIVFLFWSLAVGIVIGAGMIPLAVIGSAIIGIILLLFANRKVRSNPYILVLNCAGEDAETCRAGCAWQGERQTTASRARPSTPPASSLPQSCAPKMHRPVLSISFPGCRAWKTPRWSATTGNTCPDGERRWLHRNRSQKSSSPSWRWPYASAWPPQRIIGQLALLAGIRA